MKSTGLYALSMVNGPDEFACVCIKGQSEVKYCLVPCEEMANVENFIVRTM